MYRKKDKQLQKNATSIIRLLDACFKIPSVMKKIFLIEKFPAVPYIKKDFIDDMKPFGKSRWDFLN